MMVKIPLYEEIYTIYLRNNFNFRIIWKSMILCEF